ncbi:MAG: hypothetical protein ABI600_12285 [Luteolibacter sp.]
MNSETSKAEEAVYGNPALNEFRSRMRARVPRVTWPLVDRVFHTLQRIKADRVSLDVDLHMLLLEATSSDKLKITGHAVSEMKRIADTTEDRVRDAVKDQMDDCMRSVDITRVKIKWWPVVVIGLITGGFGFVIGRQTQRDRDYYFIMRRIGDTTLSFKASPAPINTSSTHGKSDRQEPKTINFPDSEAARDSDSSGLDDLQKESTKRFNAAQQRQR